MVFGYCIYAIDSVAHLDGVEVDFHNALLAPDELDECGEISLKSFAYPRPARPEEHVLGCLLSDGAGTQFAFAPLHITLGSLLDGIIVETVVQQKALVLAGHDGHGHVGRNMLQGHPVVVPRDALTTLHLLNAADEHERSGIYRNKTIRHNSEDCRAKEGG